LGGGDRGWGSPFVLRNVGQTLVCTQVVRISESGGAEVLVGGRDRFKT
jgi:hypothetical protein